MARRQLGLNGTQQAEKLQADEYEFAERRRTLMDQERDVRIHCATR